MYLLNVISNRNIKSGELTGSEYQINNSCKNCGTPTEFKTMIFDGIKKPDDIIISSSGDIIISKKIHSLLRQTGILESDLIMVKDKKSKKNIPYYYFFSNVSLPKMDKSSTGISSSPASCKTCHRNGFTDDLIIGDGHNIKTTVTPRRYKYKNLETSLIESSNFFSTWEHFGISNLEITKTKRIKLARPKIIVKQNIKDFLENEEIKNISFEPVELLN